MSKNFFAFTVFLGSVFLAGVSDTGAGASTFAGDLSESHKYLAPVATAEAARSADTAVVLDGEALCYTAPL